VRRLAQRYGFVVVTWAVLIAMGLVMYQLVRDPALLPSYAGTQSRPDAQPGLAQLGLPSQRPPSSPGTASNLVDNWSFEQDLRGWRRLGASRMDRAVGGHTSGSAARILPAMTTEGPGHPVRVGLEYAASAVPPGSRYVATAWVWTNQPGVEVELSVVAKAGRHEEAGTGRALTMPGGHWRRVSAAHRIAAAGATVGVRLLAPALRPGQVMLVDEVVLRRG
jgi:hypothetical protein